MLLGGDGGGATVPVTRPSSATIATFPRVLHLAWDRRSPQVPSPWFQVPPFPFVRVMFPLLVPLCLSF